MTKENELVLDSSCWNKAEDNEFMFILLARDAAAPAAIATWIAKRQELGLNKPGDPQLLTASEAMRIMITQRTARENATKDDNRLR